MTWTPVGRPLATPVATQAAGRPIRFAGMMKRKSSTTFMAESTSMMS